MTDDVIKKRFTIWNKKEDDKFLNKKLSGTIYIGDEVHRTNIQEFCSKLKCLNKRKFCLPQRPAFRRVPFDEANGGRNHQNDLQPVLPRRVDRSDNQRRLRKHNHGDVRLQKIRPKIQRSHKAKHVAILI
jgi:hypothetical protein